MSDSTLDLDNVPVGNDRVLGRGHDTRSLGPSDNSDSGSDIAGNPDLALDSDTDSAGTGERGDVAMDTVEAGADIGFDHVAPMPGGESLVDGDFHDVVPLEDDGSVPDDDMPPDLALEGGEKSRPDGQAPSRQ